jgi:hypothetical protein
MKKAIRSIAVVVAVLVVIVAGWLVWGSWVSPGERRAMKDALDRTDEVAKYEGSERADYNQRFQAAKAAILICQKKEVIAYDKQIVPVLDLQLSMAQSEYATRLTASTDSRYGRKLEVIEGSSRQTEATLRKQLQGIWK